MTQTQVIREYLAKELARHDKPVPGSVIVSNTSDDITAGYIHPIKKNLIQQVVSSMKKEGLIDFEPSINPNQPHMIMLSAAGREKFSSLSTRPVVRPKTKPKQPAKPKEDKPMETKLAQNTIYKVIDLENGEIAGQCSAYTEAQEIASNHVIATHHSVKIESVSVIVMAEYEPVITARYKPAA